MVEVHFIFCISLSLVHTAQSSVQAIQITLHCCNAFNVKKKYRDSDGEAAAPCPEFY